MTSRSTIAMRGVQVVLGVAGVLLLIALLRAVGVQDVVAVLRRLGLGFVAVVALELVIDACNTRGWHATMDAGDAPRFWRLYWVRQAGTAVNQLTPTATVGGEVVKGVLLRGHMSTAHVLASLVVAKFGLVTAQALLVMCSLGIVVQGLAGTPEVVRGVLLGFVALVATIAAFFVAQRRGWMETVINALARLAPRARATVVLREHAAALDRRLRDVFQRRAGTVAAAVLWPFAGQCLSVVQMWVILAGLGATVSLTTCLAIEGASLVVDAATILVPARVGVQEGGRMLIFTAIGFDAPTALAAAIVVRLNQLAVSASGLAAFVYFSWARAPLGESISESR